jgi:hypothetical protein
MAILVDHAKYTKRFIFGKDSWASLDICKNSSKFISKKNQLKLSVHEIYQGVSIVNISLRLSIVSSHLGSIFVVDKSIHVCNTVNRFSFRTANFLSFSLTKIRGSI